VEELEAMTEKHEDEVHKLWASFEAKMARFESDKKLALEWQKEELTMVVEQRLEQLTTEAEVREEEGKIELLRRQMQRTQGYRSVAAAWAFWLKLWSAKDHKRRLLEKARRQILRAEKSAAFSFLAANADAVHEAAARQRRRSKRDQLKALVREAEREVEAQRLLNQTTAIDRDDDKAHFERVLVEQRRTCDAEKDQLLAASESDRSKEHDELRYRLNELEAAHKKSTARAESAEFELEALRKMVQSRDAELAKLKEESEQQASALRAELSQAQEKIKSGRSPGHRPAGSLEVPDDAFSPRSPMAMEADATYWHMDIDESENAKPVSEQLANALRNSSARVLDLFRGWDSNHDGKVTRAEFHKAMKVLGYDVLTKEIVRATQPISGTPRAGLHFAPPHPRLHPLRALHPPSPDAAAC
jgi:hypothetical protein